MIGAGVDGDTLELTPDSESGIRAQLANTTPNCGVVHAWLYKICPLDMEVEPAEKRRIIRLRRNWLSFLLFLLNKPHVAEKLTPRLGNLSSLAGS